jgi:hypothetical protein
MSSALAAVVAVLVTRQHQEAAQMAQAPVFLALVSQQLPLQAAVEAEAAPALQIPVEIKHNVMAVLVSQLAA